MIRKVFVFACLAVAAGLLAPVTVDAAVDAIYSDGSWHQAPVSSGIYRDLAADSQLAFHLYGANPSGGLDQVAYSGAWNTTPVSFASGTSGTYSALGASSQVSDFIYGAKVGGGADVMYYDGAWQLANALGAATSYNDIAADVQQERALAASATGSVEMVFNFGGTWNTNPITFDIGTPGTYTSLVGTKFGSISGWFGTRADQGIDYMYFDTWWRVYHVLPNEGQDVKYNSITADPTGGQYYAARAGGGVDRIFSYGTSWYAAAINFPIGTPSTYTQLVADSQRAQTMFGRRADSGVDVLYFDTWWRAYNLYGTPTYGALAADSQNGWWVYGTNVPEPTSVLALGAGFISLAGFVIRRRR